VGLKIATNQITGYDQFAPFIVHLEKPQKHFSIYLGSYYQYLLFADPSIGLYFGSAVIIRNLYKNIYINILFHFLFNFFVIVSLSLFG